MLDKLNFSCNACGLCCGTPPDIYLSELVSQSKNFILCASFSVLPHIDPDDEEDLKILDRTYPNLPTHIPEVRDPLIEHVNHTGNTRCVRCIAPFSAGSQNFIGLSFVDVEQKSGSCPRKEDDGKCGIYADRPSKCKVVPFDESVPEGLAGLEANSAIKFLIAGGGTCGIGPSDPEVWADKKYTDADTKSAFKEIGRHLTPRWGALNKAVIEEYFSYKMAETGAARELLDAVFQQMDKEGRRVSLALVPALFALRQHEAISARNAVEVLQNQSSLIEARLPTITDNREISGILGTPMRKVLSDWRDTYTTIAAAWSQSI